MQLQRQIELYPRRQMLQKNLGYKATVYVNNNNAMMYYELCKTEFKFRYQNHLQSFKHRHKASATELLKFIWRCKYAGLKLTVSWESVRHVSAYNSGKRVCQLCLEEKYQILILNCANTLNKRFEIISKCRHTNKFK